MSKRNEKHINMHRAIFNYFLSTIVKFFTAIAKTFNKRGGDILYVYYIYMECGKWKFEMTFNNLERGDC